jgi:hypothetical protein
MKEYDIRYSIVRLTISPILLLILTSGRPLATPALFFFSQSPLGSYRVRRHCRAEVGTSFLVPNPKVETKANQMRHETFYIIINMLNGFTSSSMSHLHPRWKFSIF